MKKILLSLTAFLLFTFSGFSQANIIVEAPQNNGSTSANRAPNGTSGHTFMRACFLVLASELGNLPNGTSITSFGYTLSAGANAAVPGNYTLYLQNTTDNTYQKGTSWSTALTGMTSVYASAFTVPLSAGTTSVTITLTTPFTYSGSGLYVAYDWASGTPFATTAAIYLCEANALPLPGGGGATGASNSAAPTTLGVTNFRPAFLFGFANPYSNDMNVQGGWAPGNVPAMLNTPHTISAMVKNGSNTTLSSISVSLNVTGANPFTDVQTISSLAAGASTLMNFAAFNPVIPGSNTIVIEVPTDQNNVNNLFTYVQYVNCNKWSQNPSTGSYTNGAGFAGGSGMVVVNYLSPVSSTLSGLRLAVSSATTGLGQSVYGALLSSTGATIAVTNPVTITSTMLGTTIDLPFSTPQVLSAITSYYLAGAQPVGSIPYHPFGTQAAPYVPANVYGYIAGLAGGAILPMPPGLNSLHMGLEAIFTPTITLAVTPQTVSCGNTATLQANSSTNYSWSTGAGTSSIVVSPTVSTSYTVVATNTMGCMNTKTVQLTITPITISPLASADTICLGNTVGLSVSGASSYSWSSGTSTNSPSFTDSPQLTTVYSVTGSIPAGCVNIATVKVAVQTFSTLSVSAPSHTICHGNTAVLIASGAASYTWDSGSGTQNGPNLFASPQANTTYTVTGADNLGCTMERTVNVNVIIVPLEISGDTAVCHGSAITLTATGANSFLWTTPTGTSPFQSLFISPAVLGAQYTVTGTGQQNCTVSAVVNLSINPNPTVTAVAQRSVMCVKEPNKITAGGASTYSWSTGALTNTILITPQNNLPVNLQVWGYSAEGCRDDAVVSVVVNGCIGLAEHTRTDRLKIFPNPGTGIFNVETYDMNGATLQLHNALGALVLEQVIGADKTVVDISAQPAGVYLISIRGQGPAAVRLIKQ